MIEFPTVRAFLFMVLSARAFFVKAILIRALFRQGYFRRTYNSGNLQEINQMNKSEWNFINPEVHS